MEALVSGQAGLAIVLDDPPEFRPVGGEPYKGSQADIEAALGGAPDVERVTIDSGRLDRLDRQATASWARDRAIYRLYILFDDCGHSESFEQRIVDEITAMARPMESPRRLRSGLRTWSSDRGTGRAQKRWPDDSTD
jgi:hypothetical protein